MTSRRPWVLLAAFLGGCSLFSDLGSLSGTEATPGSEDGGPGTTGDGAVAASDGGEPDAGSSRTRYVVVVGGRTSGSDALATTLLARILPDGSLGAWQPGPDLPEGRKRHGVHGVKGSVYVIGGFTVATPTESSVVLRAKLRADGTLEAFQPAAALPEQSSDVFPFDRDGRLFVVSPYFDAVYNATLLDDGIGGWKRQSGLGAQTVYGYTVRLDRRVFVFGHGARSLASEIDQDGMLKPWVPARGLPMEMSAYAGATVADATHVWMVGGFVPKPTGGGTLVADVAVSTVADDGSLGAWRTTEPSFPVRDAYGVVATDRHLYVLGGAVGGTPTAEVTYAAILTDGSLSPWKSTTPLPAPRLDPVYTVIE